MNLLAEALAWIFSPDRATGSPPLVAAIGLHLFYTFISVVIASLVAIPLGYYIGHTGKGRNLAIGVSGAARAIPSFGLILLLLVLVLGVTQKPIAAAIAFVLLGIPSILCRAYSSIVSGSPSPGVAMCLASERSISFFATKTLTMNTTIIPTKI